MASDSINIDNLIKDLGDFGPFQVLMLVFTSCVRLVAGMSMILMAFGNYNPGWECLDNATTADGNGSNLSMTIPKSSSSNDTSECHRYEACSNVQFKPGISTVVTEWELACDTSWIPSLIISLQMVGLLLGSYLTGYLGDKIGRKWTLVVAISYHMVVNVITIFSNSWHMFAVMRFLIGIALPTFVFTPVVLMLEFVPRKWRATVVCLPALSIGFVTMALSAMITEDWKYLHVLVAIGSFISLLPYLWIPDSLRWLVVNDKLTDAIAVVKRMAKMNGKNVNETQIVKELTNIYNSQPEAGKKNCFQLLSQLLRKGVRYPTFVVGLLCVSMSMIYYAISFGVKSLPGNFFTNFIIISCSSFPMTPVIAILPNYTGRKRAMIIFLVICTTSLFIIVGLDQHAEGRLNSIGILGCVIVARMVVGATWDTAVTYTGETFPTVMRSTSIAYTSWIARIGGILAPYLIPNNPDTYFINYLIMAVCALICCSLVFFLPETNGKPLQDVWGETADIAMENVSIRDKNYQEKKEALLD